jgi:hypothetical protein
MPKKTSAKRSTKKRARTGRKLLDLPAKTVARGDAESVKGGLIPVVCAPDKKT